MGTKRATILRQPDYVTVPPKLLLDFFLTLAQFEFALKNSGFHVRRPGELCYPAHPDWDRFAESLRNSFDAGRTPTLRKASDYLLISPPWEEVVIESGLGWNTKPPEESLPTIVRLIRCVRRIRNNLFHGGKFTTLPIQDGNRNRVLFQSALVVLEECLRLSDDVRSVYEGVAI